MKYLNAKKVLPEHLLKEIQNYTQGNYLYIPVEEGQHKNWGELSGCRAAIAERNEQITLQFLGGTTVKELSEKYFLSSNAIRKIINNS